MADAPIQLLEQVPLFQGLPHHDLERVARSFKERHFSAGDTVAAEGSGGVDFFGEIALIDDQARRTATITAETDLTCYGLTSWDFRPLVETNAEIAWKLLQVMAKRLREAEQQHA